MNSIQLPPRPLGGEGPGGEGVELGTVSLSEQYWGQAPGSYLTILQLQGLKSLP